MVLQFCAGARYGADDTIRWSSVGVPDSWRSLGAGWTSRMACSFRQPDRERLVGSPPWPLGAPWDMRHPARIFNGMIAPLAGFAMRGVLWYQGETDVPHHADYRLLLSALIRDWRARWRQEHLHFGIVQLSDLGPVCSVPMDSDLARLREAQQLVADTVGDAGVATAVDSGEPDDVHPRDKQRPAHRLADWALAQVYRSGGRSGSPRIESCAFSGNMVRVVVIGVRASLKTRDGESPRSFAIAGADGVFRSAEATIAGRDAIELRVEGVAVPRHVRYAWSGNPRVNLVDGDGYPVLPFRTDTW